MKFSQKIVKWRLKPFMLLMVTRYNRGRSPESFREKLSEAKCLPDETPVKDATCKKRRFGPAFFKRSINSNSF